MGALASAFGHSKKRKMARHTDFTSATMLMVFYAEKNYFYFCAYMYYSRRSLTRQSEQSAIYGMHLFLEIPIPVVGFQVENKWGFENSEFLPHARHTLGLTGNLQDR
jgi:hypothetical protein